MDERVPSRRLRLARALEPVDLPGPREEETAASILPGAPRVGALDALLREVDELRLTLETDLTLAAAAVEAGGTATASAIIDGDLESLHAFETKALGHLDELAGTAPRGGRWESWARLSAAPFVAAAAVIGLLIGVVPHIGGSAGPSDISSVSAQSSLAQLTTLAEQGRTSEVRVAAMTLHNQISELVGDSANNPVTAQQALLLLSYERSVIVQSGDGAALHDVLVQSAALAAKIRSALPAALRTNVPKAPALLPAASPAPRRESSRPRGQAEPEPQAEADPVAVAVAHAVAEPRADEQPELRPVVEP